MSFDTLNTLTTLNVWKCPTSNGISDYLVVHYTGLNSSNVAVEWYLTFFNDGNNKFLVDIKAFASNVSELCQRENCYQELSIAGPTLYTAGSTCFDCLILCNGSSDCRKKCAGCYVYDENVQINHNGILLAGVLGGIVLIAIIVVVVIAVVCCKRLISRRSCCICCPCCACCPEQISPEDDLPRARQENPAHDIRDLI